MKEMASLAEDSTIKAYISEKSTPFLRSREKNSAYEFKSIFTYLEYLEGTHLEEAKKLSRFQVLFFSVTR